MARIEANAAGQLVRVIFDAQPIDPGTHPQATQSLTFGDGDNAALVADLLASTDPFTLAAGVLKKNNVAQAVNADSALTIQRRGNIAGARRVSADRSTSGTAFVDVPDMQFQLDANATYAFWFDGGYTAALGTTGVGLALNGPAFNFLSYGVEIATANNPAAWVQGLFAAYDTGLLATASGGTTPCPYHVYGNIETTAAGVLVLRGKSEVSGSAVTIKRGSQALLLKVG